MERQRNEIIWTQHVSLPQLMLDSDIVACIHLLNCKPVDTQIMGICFHKRTNLMGTWKVTQHRRVALHQNRCMCFYALFIPLNGILYKNSGWGNLNIIPYRSDNSIVWEWHRLDRIDCDSECLQRIMGDCVEYSEMCVCHKTSNRKLIRLIWTSLSFLLKKRLHLSTHACSQHLFSLVFKQNPPQID